MMKLREKRTIPPENIVWDESIPVAGAGTALPPEIPAPTFSSTDLFRNPTKLLPLLGRRSGYVIYYVSSHGSYIGTTVMRRAFKKPYAVVQTGARDSVGCQFQVGCDNILMNLFTINLLFTFQYLLGLYNDALPPLFEDLTYATTDQSRPLLGSPMTARSEKLPLKLLYYSKKEATTDPDVWGVFVYDPDVARTKKPGAPLFDRMNDPEVEEMFTREEGVHTDEVIDALLASTTKPAIFVFSSCANLVDGLDDVTVREIIKTTSAQQFFSHSPPEPGLPYFEFKGEKCPAILVPLADEAERNATAPFVDLWRNTAIDPVVKEFHAANLKAATRFVRKATAKKRSASGKRKYRFRVSNKGDTTFTRKQKKGKGKGTRRG